MSAISRFAAATCVAALSITTSALAEGPSLETLMKRDFLPPAMAADQARILGQFSELDEEGASKGGTLGSPLLDQHEFRPSSIERTHIIINFDNFKNLLPGLSWFI